MKERLLRRGLIGSLVVLVLPIALPALAKGPLSATIDGPGLEKPIVVDGDPHPGAGTDFSEFVEATGFWQLAYGVDIDGTGLQVMFAAPTKCLGAEYVVMWSHGGSDPEIPSLLYPFAEGGALFYVEPGVRYESMGLTTHGGWYRSSHDIQSMLRSYGVDVSAVKGVSSSAAEAVPDPPVESKAAAEPVLASPEPEATDQGGSQAVAAWSTLLGLTGLAGFWAIRRRPRRLGVVTGSSR